MTYNVYYSIIMTIIVMDIMYRLFGNENKNKNCILQLMGMRLREYSTA